MKFLKNEKKKMETRNTWDKQKTNRRMTDSIISIIILKGNSINIPLKKKKSIPAETVKNCQCWDFPSGPVADSEFPRQGSWAQPLTRDLRCHMLQLRSHRPIKEPTCLN